MELPPVLKGAITERAIDLDCPGAELIIR